MKRMKFWKKTKISTNVCAVAVGDFICRQQRAGWASWTEIGRRFLSSSSIQSCSFGFFIDECTGLLKKKHNEKKIVENIRRFVSFRTWVNDDRQVEWWLFSVVTSSMEDQESNVSNESTTDVEVCKARDNESLVHLDSLLSQNFDSTAIDRVHCWMNSIFSMTNEEILPLELTV